MNCLKCGKETEGKQVFCADCRAAAEAHPVAYDAVVHLPEQRTAHEKTVARRELTDKDIIRQQRKMIRWLTATVGVLTVLLCLLAGIFINYLSNQNSTGIIGQNYSTADPESGS